MNFVITSARAIRDRDDFSLKNYSYYPIDRFEKNDIKN